MANYNLAFGGDNTANQNNSLYPQNAYIAGRPEFGDYDTILKPADHWRGGVYAPVRHMSFDDPQHQCALNEVGRKLVTGDTFLTHLIPAKSLVTGFSYTVHTPVEGVNFTVQLAAGTVLNTEDPPVAEPVVLGTIDGSVAGDGWFQLDTPFYVDGSTNDAIEIVVDAWPTPEEEDVEEDPCGVYGPCPVGVPFCWSSVVYYQNGRYENWCYDTCYD